MAATGDVATFQFKSKHTLEKRKAMAQKYRLAVPPGIPIVLENAASSPFQALFPVTKIFCIKDHSTVLNFHNCVRKETNLKPLDLLALVAEAKLIQPRVVQSDVVHMSQVYQDHHDEDGILYIKFSAKMLEYDPPAAVNSADENVPAAAVDSADFELLDYSDEKDESDDEGDVASNPLAIFMRVLALERGEQPEPFSQIDLTSRVPSAAAKQILEILGLLLPLVASEEIDELATTPTSEKLAKSLREFFTTAKAKAVWVFEMANHFTQRKFSEELASLVVQILAMKLAMLGVTLDLLRSDAWRLRKYQLTKPFAAIFSQFADAETLLNNATYTLLVLLLVDSEIPQARKEESAKIIQELTHRAHDSLNNCWDSFAEEVRTTYRFARTTAVACGILGAVGTVASGGGLLGVAALGTVAGACGFLGGIISGDHKALKVLVLDKLYPALLVLHKPRDMQIAHLRRIVDKAV